MASEKAKRAFLLFVVFTTGFCVMAVEMAASRLLAPYFGTSLFVWTNLIGITMIALTVGYWWGGGLADRFPNSRTLYWIIFVAGCYILLIPFIARPIMEFAVSAIDQLQISVFLWSLFATIFLFFIPIVALAMTTPFAIRISARELKTIGNTSGSIYALSNVGSIIGTFIPALLTIPLFGTKRTIIVCGLILITTAAIGLQRRLLHLATLCGILLLFIGGPVKATTGMIYEGESPYNYIQVIEHPGGTRELRLNEGHATHSVYIPDSVMVGGEWDYFSLFPILKSDNKRALMIGLAAGSISRAYNALYPNIAIDGVEIDPQILEVGAKYFGETKELQPTLNAIAADGRTFLKQTDQQYDLVFIDAYRQPYIPFHLTTQEFFSEVKTHLTPGGIVSINVGSPSPNAELLWMVANTMASVFKEVQVAKIPGTFNYILMASDQHYDWVGISGTELDSRLRRVASQLVGNVDLFSYDPAKIVLTDDAAPVELFTEKMIIDYARA